MIQNIVKGRGFRGALAYVVGKDGAERIAGNVDGRNARELAAEFRAVRAQRPDVERAVFHASLAAPIGEQLTNAQWAALAEQYLERMGFGASPYVVVRHRDAAHEHVHVVASRIDVYGRVVPDAHDHYKGQEILRALEQEYGLTAVAPSWARGPDGRKQRTVAEVQQDRASAAQHGTPFRDLVQTHAPAAFREARSWDDLDAKLRAVGLALVPKRGGLALVEPDTGESVKASAAGRDCARGKLEQRFGVTYEQWQRDIQHQREQSAQRADERALNGHALNGLAPARDADGTARNDTLDGAAGSQSSRPDRSPRDRDRADRDVGRDARGLAAGAPGRAGGDARDLRGGAAGAPGRAPIGAGDARGRAGELAPGAGDVADRATAGSGGADGRGEPGHERAGAGDAGPARAGGLGPAGGRNDAGGAAGPGGGAPADALGAERDGHSLGADGARALPGAERGADVVGHAPSGAGRDTERDREHDPAGSDAIERRATILRRDLEHVERIRAERAAHEAARRDAEQRAHVAGDEHRALTAHHRQATGRAVEGYTRALGAVYRDPAAAGLALDARAEAAGWDAAVRALRERPERFGALRGHQVGPFVVAGSERDRARGAAPALAGWAAERYAAEAAERAGRPELARLAATATQATHVARTAAQRAAALPTERELLRGVAERAELLTKRLAPEERAAVEQRLAPPHQAFLGEARAFVQERVQRLARELLRDQERDRDRGIGR